MTKRLFIILLAITFSSCKHINYVYTNYISSGDVVAKVDDKVLYKSDIKKIVPRGITGQDSIDLVQQYINSWAQKQFMLQEAQKSLSKGERDVSKELQEYKEQLLIFRFESSYVEQNLDTVITKPQMEEYYNNYPDIFKAKNGILKARIIKLQNSSPNLRVVKNLAKKESEEDLAQLENEIYNSAYKYTVYQEWTDLSLISKEVGLTLAQMQESLSNKRVVEVKDSLYTTIIVATDYIAQESVTPFEYNTQQIKGLMLVKRKKELISKLHRDVLNSALDLKKLKIINDEKTSN